MNASRSTPRVRLMSLAVIACIAAVAVADRPALPGLAGWAAGFAGFVLVAIAALGRLWTSLFIAGRKDTTLVQDGPYAACRHPLYFLSLVAMVGFGLATRSLVLLAALVALAAVLHVRAMRVEDAVLESVHDGAARRYRAEVPGLWPDFPRLAVPVTLEIQPQVVWKAVLDAGSLLLAFALLQSAHCLQVAGWYEPWLQLP